MFRLKEAGERGGTLSLTASPFDVLSVIEGLTTAVIRLEKAAEEYRKEHGEFDENRPETEMLRLLEVKAKDARANISELQAVIDDREVLLKR